MNYTLARRLIICLAIGLFIGVFSSNAFAGGSISVRWGESDGIANHEDGYKHKKTGPPPHATAYGYRAKYQYRYYPDCSVYHDTDRGLYFYLKGDNWEIGASLPTNLRMALGESVSLELDTDKPYIYHAEHVKQYPPGQMKDKDKKKNKNG
jgi:hypothetical protein